MSTEQKSAKDAKSTPSIPEKLPTVNVRRLYTDEDINNYVEGMIRYSNVGGYRPKHLYLLNDKFSDDGQDYLVAVTNAVDCASRALPLDHFLDVDKQERTSLSIYLSQLVEKLNWEVLSKQDKGIDAENAVKTQLRGIIGEGKYDESFIDALYKKLSDLKFNLEAVKKEIESLDKRDRRDVFEELMPALLENYDAPAHAKILFPFNITQIHWLTGEIKIHRNGNQYQVEVQVHDPYGGGELNKNQYEIIEAAIKKQIIVHHNKLSHEKIALKDIKVESKLSAYKARQHRDDQVSCGVIAATDIMNRLYGCRLDDHTYEIGAQNLREEHIKDMQEKLPDTESAKRNFARRNTGSDNVEGEKDFQDLLLMLSLLEVSGTQGSLLSQRLYTDEDINNYVDSMINYTKLGGYRPQHLYLLNNTFFDKKDEYLVAVANAVDYASKALPIDHFLDIDSQERTSLVIYLEKTVDNKTWEQIIKLSSDEKAEEKIKLVLQNLVGKDKYDVQFIDALYNKLKSLKFNHQAVKSEIKELDKRDRHDVFEELMPELLKSYDLPAHAKIIFPFNITQIHWLAGEIKIHREGNQYRVEVQVHDPYGKGQLDQKQYQKIEATLIKQIIVHHKKIRGEDITEKNIKVENKPSEFLPRQHKNDKTSCGVIAASDMLARIQGMPLNEEHQVGAIKLRQKHVEDIQKYLPDTNPIKKQFANRNKIQTSKSDLSIDEQADIERATMESLLSFNQDAGYRNAKLTYLQLLDQSKLTIDTQKLVEQQLKEYPQFIMLSNKNGETLLHLVVKNKDTELVNFVLKQRVNINAVDNEGNTALHYAIQHGDINLVNSLIKNRPSLSIKNKSGITPLEMAISQKNKIPGKTDLIASMLEDYQAHLPAIELPKIIHFVWAGGRKLLPDDCIESISKWAEKNPSFEIFLWVDEETSGKSLEWVAQYYQTKFAKELAGKGVQVWIGNKRFGSDSPDAAKIIIKDVRQEAMLDEASKYEIEKHRPNYGASSDDLRYRILYTYGGAYFDSDIKPPEKGTGILKNARNLEDLPIFQKPPEKHVLFIEHLSQQPNAKVEQQQMAFDDKLERMGNDAFICTKGNPLMQMLYTSTLENYTDTTEFANRQKRKLLEVRIMFAYGAHNRRFTIAMTGPSHIRNMILGNKLITTKEGLQLNLPGGEVVLKPLRSDEYCLTEPLENTLNWLKIFITPCKDVDEAINKSIDHIRFEIEHFGMLRLEDYIVDIQRAARVKNPEEFIDIFLARVKNEILTDEALVKKIQICPYLYEFPEVEKLYKEHKMPGKTTLLNKAKLDDLSYLPLIIAQGGSLEMMQEILLSEQSKRLDKDYNDTQRIEVLYYIERGFNFINKLLVNPSLDYSKVKVANLSSLDRIMKMTEQVLDHYAKVLKVLGSGTRTEELEKHLQKTLEKLNNLNKIIAKLREGPAFEREDAPPQFKVKE